MLRIKNAKHLAAQTGFTVSQLYELHDNTSKYHQVLLLIDPRTPEKRRTVLNVSGALRRFQERLLRNVLVQRLQPSPYSHGGVSGRNIKTNAEPHIWSNHVFTTDISNFYPSIRRDDIYRLFVNQFDCSPDVARICTRLCSYSYHLALGMITSPFLADQIMRPIDKRISAACRKLGPKAALVYSRFVDDITITAQCDLNDSGIRTTVKNILREHGLRVNQFKEQIGPLEEVPITSLLIKKRKIDIQEGYLKEIYRQLQDAGRLAAGGELSGPYFTRQMLSGRISFASWINPRRKGELRTQFNGIPWNKFEAEARRRGLLIERPQLIPKI